ncbi:uncharacterized protein LOC100824723 [Brachypodium distachyon]|uniref:Uncharacterized protein n=1 Tax=Brachypodium distachyon TaxID=15368 RepID=I1IJ43_BRADI|nr:uncharacterized protein LOC100824723 [Brachypodium distachyon]KQJ87098.1 hypothetical protein BRADI_4g09330v3 [Brachypodium distachyon]PNT62900.1 hypothetical protein BRADI_4g09330v3 [Brachypodium distachyon]|eukprot:XP_010237375.1 uncharacterized protein LOC100824723 [Brachypodium distachyon]
MRALSKLGVGLTAVSALLLLALAAELYYILVHRRRRRAAAAVSDAVSSSSPSSSSRELLHLFCFKKPPPAAAATTEAADPEAAVAGEDEEEDDEDESVEAQLMRLGSLVGPPRLLFTIKEETREDLDSDDGGRSRSLADLLHRSPLFLTPASSPPVVESSSFNPLYEPPAAAAPSPPPSLQFLKDAEEKLYRRALAEEAKRARLSPSPAAGDEEGGFITIVVGKNNRVIPLPPSP